MGGILSSQSTTITVTEVQATQTTVEESKPTDTVQTTTLISETTPQTVTESVPETVAPITTDIKAETEQNSVEPRPEEVLERYVEPTGTKLEVAPVEVAPSADVVKKSKKKNKKHH
jgi:hypothetical protein